MSTGERVEVDVRWRDEPATGTGEEHSTTDERRHSAATARRLDEAIRHLERVDFREVPGVSALTAAVVVEQLHEARRELREAES